MGHQPTPTSEAAGDRAGRAHITGMGFASPAIRPQSELAEWLQHHLALNGGETTDATVESVFARSPIKQRPIALLDPQYAHVGAKAGQAWSLTHAMGLYGAVASRIAHESAHAALSDAGLGPGDVTDLVFVSSTGTSLPGPDIGLIRDVGLSPSINRKAISGMGCSGAFYGLETARTITAANPSAVVLLTCVEVCSAHVQSDARRQSIVAHSLFGDAAASLVIRGTQGVDQSNDEDTIASVGRLESLVAPEHSDLIRWDLDSAGFQITLSPRLPIVVGRLVKDFAAPLVCQISPTGDFDDIDSWSVHPGGTAILDKIESALDLSPTALDSSRSIFEKRGNLSSTAVLFTLAAERNRHAADTTGIMLGFGPGLAMAGTTYRFGGKATPRPV